MAGGAVPRAPHGACPEAWAAAWHAVGVTGATPSSLGSDDGGATVAAVKRVAPGASGDLAVRLEAGDGAVADACVSREAAQEAPAVAVVGAVVVLRCPGRLACALLDAARDAGAPPLLAVSPGHVLHAFAPAWTAATNASEPVRALPGPPEGGAPRLGPQAEAEERGRGGGAGGAAEHVVEEEERAEGPAGVPLGAGGGARGAASGAVAAQEEAWPAFPGASQVPPASQCFPPSQPARMTAGGVALGALLAGADAGAEDDDGW